MSELNIELGYTIAYIGPKKVEFPPYINNVTEIGKAKLKLMIEQAEKEGNVVTIEAKKVGKPVKVEKKENTEKENVEKE